ncbi:uncharacterized protein LOC6566571 [Drosophila grimshawi]|uniref:GH13262 n=1 Tax=Drosophila grimshawi TaxID=7222 RepID=B4JQ59_DROGR|nr:uncharacterized protein LOC6566571 [Drosophila grimshawi]EDV99039.1 GH13262 [Drosophila grimshawi]
MVSPPSIVAATLLQICGVSLFIRQPAETPCSPAPCQAKWLFGLSLVLLLWRCELLPKRYASVYPRIHTCVELLGSVFVSELAMLIGWCSYERLVHQLSHLICLNLNLNCRWCEYFTLGMLTLLPSGLLLFTLAPAQWREFLVQLLWQLPRPEADECLLSCARELSNYARGLLCFCQLRREDRLRALRLFQLQAERSSRHEERQP